MTTDLFYYKYMKYRSKYNELNYNLYTLGEINSSEGSGCTRAFNVYNNQKNIGIVVCSPFCLYSKFTPYIDDINNFDIDRIEKKAYNKFISIIR